MKLSIDLPKMNKRQAFYINQLQKEHRLGPLLEYLSTFNGNRSSVSPKRYKSNKAFDLLSEKSSGTVLAQFKRMFNTAENHFPTKASTDCIGIEIECLIPNRYDSVSLKTIFEGAKVKFVTIKYDGSIRAGNGFNGQEITVLTQESNPSNLIKACEILNNIGAKVNNSCGLHVHLDCRGMNQDQVHETGKNFSKAMPVLVAMVPNSRRNNTYCRPRVSRLRGNRYYAVNLTAFRKFKTIEIRLHSATTDYNKIMSWAKLCLAIKNNIIKKKCNTINELTEYIKIDETLLEYIGQRTELFNPSDWNIVIKDQYQDLDAA